MGTTGSWNQLPANTLVLVIALLPTGVVMKQLNTWHQFLVTNLPPSLGMRSICMVVVTVRVLAMQGMETAKKKSPTMSHIFSLHLLHMSGKIQLCFVLQLLPAANMF